MPDSDEPLNIRISVESDETVELLKERGYFDDAISAFRAAVCVAISLDLPVDASVPTPRNKWDTASVFRNTEANLEDVLLLMGVPREEVVNVGRLKGEAGLRYLRGKLTANVDILPILVPGYLSDAYGDDE